VKLKPRTTLKPRVKLKPRMTPSNLRLRVRVSQTLLHTLLQN
jgi:hypothetical protein